MIAFLITLLTNKYVALVKTEIVQLAFIYKLLIYLHTKDAVNRNMCTQIIIVDYEEKNYTFLPKSEILY